MMKLLWVTNGPIGVKPMNTSQRQQLWNILGGLCIGVGIASMQNYPPQRGTYMYTYRTCYLGNPTVEER